MFLLQALIHVLGRLVYIAFKFLKMAFANAGSWVPPINIYLYHS